MPDSQVGEQDRTLLALARAALVRGNGAAAAAAVRDGSGRTYVASEVSLPSLQLEALQAAVAAAFSSGARELSSAVHVGVGSPGAAGLAAVRDLAGPGGVAVLVAGPDGAVRDVLS